MKHGMTESLPMMDEGSEKSLTEYLLLIKKNWFWVAGCAAASGLLALFYVLSIPTSYETSAQILVEKVDKQPAAPQYQELVLPSLSAEEDYFGTQTVVLTSNKILREAARQVGLPEGTPFVVLDSDKPLQIFRGVSAGNSYRVEAARKKKSRVISLTVKGPDPSVCRDLANAITEVYVRQNAMENLFVSKQMYKWLDEEGEGAEPMDPVRRDELANSLQTVVNDPELIKLRNEKDDVLNKLRELSQRYRPIHPKVKELSLALDGLNRDIQQRRETLVSGVKESLKGAMNITNVRILDPAVEPEDPSRSGALLLVLIGTFIGALAGCIGVLLRELLDQTVRTEKDLPASSATPYLGAIPMVQSLKNGVLSKSLTTSTYVELLNNDLELRDAVVGIRTHVLFSIPYERSKRVMFASTTAEEGKSTVAILISLSLASMGRRILLIDADMRTPDLHRHLGLDGGKGLSDLLSGEAKIDEVIRTVPGATLDVITGGSATDHSSALLASPQFDQLLEGLGKKYDRIILSVPAILHIPDGMIIAKSVSCGILVCASGVADRGEVEAVRHKFSIMDRPLVGIVINRLKVPRKALRGPSSVQNDYINRHIQIQPVKIPSSLQAGTTSQTNPVKHS